MRILLIIVSLLSFSVSASAEVSQAPVHFIYDATTQTVLSAKDADTPYPPASMTKLMTLYLLFDRLKSGELTLESQLSVSEKAWRKGGSKMFVNVNSLVSVEDLIRGIVVQSGNDACIVVAEGLAGSEEAFAALMTSKAKALGLTQSHFTNSTGWPDEKLHMSAKDLAILAERIMSDFPDYYPYFAETEFAYNNITQQNRNPLLSSNLGVDGLKTGHTEEAGYGITLSAEKDGRRLIAVINGTESMAARKQAGRSALTLGFSGYKAQSLFNETSEIMVAPVWNGAEASVGVGPGQAVQISLPLVQDALRFEADIATPIKAPLSKGSAVGELKIYDGDLLMKSVPLVSLNNVESAGFFTRLKRNLFGAAGK